MLAEAPDGDANPPRLDVVGSVAEEHRRFDDLGAELVEVRAGFDAADELVRVGRIAHFAEDANRLGKTKAATDADDRQLVVAEVDLRVAHPLVKRFLGEEDTVLGAGHGARGYTSPRAMRRSSVLEAAARILQLGGEPSRAAHVAAMRATFEGRTGAFAPEDSWFDERSRAFWADAITSGRFGREVEGHLAPEEAQWLAPLERAHRGLFRAEGRLLVDVWSGAEFRLTEVDDESNAELGAGAGQLFDARVVGGAPATVALLPGAVFHPRHAMEAIETVLAAARAGGLATNATLDALLRMERTLRALSRVKAAYAYRPSALTPTPVTPLPGRARRHESA